MKHLFTISALLLLGAAAPAADYKPYPAVFAPVRTEELRAYIINGVPIASVAGDSSYALLSLETGRIGSDRYVKLWALYQNLGAEPYLFEPLNHIKVTVETAEGTQPGLLPAPPSQLAKHVDAEEQVGAIHARYSAALRTIAAETASEPSAPPAVAPYDASAPPPQDEAAEAARARVRSASYMYPAFINSANSGLLRASTVFPGKGITGHVYVLAGDADLEHCTKVTLYLTTGDGIRAVEFRPMAGE